jgi:hypothetical protein
MSTDRKPTPDESAGMTWWNGLTKQQRAEWLERAGSAIPAHAWAEFKRAKEIAGVEL